MARYQDRDLSQLTDEQKRIWDEIAAGPRGTMPPPHQIWLTNPAFCDPAQKVGAYCRYGSNLPAALSELAILVVGRAWRADYEWWAHAKLAADAGVSDAIIEAVRTGAEPDFDGAQENADIVFRTAKELVETKRLSDATFAEADQRLGRKAFVDLVGIVGYYCLISATLNVFEVPTPDGSAPFADQPPA